MASAKFTDCEGLLAKLLFAEELDASLHKREEVLSGRRSGVALSIIDTEVFPVSWFSAIQYRSSRTLPTEVA